MEFAETLGRRSRPWQSAAAPPRCTRRSRRWVSGPGQEVIVPAYMWVSVLAAVVNLGAIPVWRISTNFCWIRQPGEADHARRQASYRAHERRAGRREGAPEKSPRNTGCFCWRTAPSATAEASAAKVVDVWRYGHFSFQMNKNMTAGEGGGVVTNDTRLYQRALPATISAMPATSRDG